jgi:hypothetical protein
VPRGQRDGSLRPYSRFSRQEPLLFYQVAPQLYSRVDPVRVCKMRHLIAASKFYLSARPGFDPHREHWDICSVVGVACEVSRVST